MFDSVFITSTLVFANLKKQCWLARQIRFTLDPRFAQAFGLTGPQNGVGFADSF